MLNKLRESMKENNMSVFVIPTCDYHDSEYVDEHFAVRKFLSGFTGSAGTFVVTLDEAALFVDGRYFVQAAHQIEGTEIILMKMGEPGVPTVNEYIENKVIKGTNIGVDGRVISFDLGRGLEDIARTADGKVIDDKDLAGDIWEGRPAIEHKPIILLEEKYTGKTVAEKLEKVRESMKGFGANAHLITTLDDIAYLFNFRGKDIPENPVAYAYAMILEEKVILYMGDVLTDEQKAEFGKNNIALKNYDDIYDDAKEMKNMIVLTEVDRTNYTLVNSLGVNNRVKNATNPTTLMKAVKNDTEIKNTKNIHILDGVAVTKFMYYIKKNAPDGNISEQDAADYIDNLRSQIPGYMDLSFGTISAYGENAAMMHYSAQTGNNAIIKKGGMLLVDSGGQYFEGTTDITRTFIIGEATDQMKKHFTTVAKSMLRLANVKFLYGCSGLNLDIIAREPLWSMGMDYKCGTGHGVGHILNVHEGPNSFRWKMIGNKKPATLEAGMITTDEPGVYLEGQYGIRTENELLCKELETNSDGTFMGFETITFAPIDIDGIDKTYLEESDVKLLNDYHKEVFKKISPFLNDEEKAWLAEYTKTI